MYIRVNETSGTLSVSVDLSRISRDTANAAELAKIMSVINDFERLAYTLDAWVAAKIAPF